MSLNIPLTRVAALRERGTYGRDRVLAPWRYLFLSVAAAESALAIEREYPGCIHYSDIYRSADGSRRRRQKNREARIRRGLSPVYTGMLPGYSGHGYGLCTDHAVSGNLARMGELFGRHVPKIEYDAIMRGYGWYCHRDGPRGDHAWPAREAWHYNFFGDDAAAALLRCGRTTAGGLEWIIGGRWDFDAEVDVGDVETFQRKWTLQPDGILGPITRRVALYVDATYDIDDRTGFVAAR